METNKDVIRESVEKVLRGRLETQRVKPGSNKALNIEVEFISGAAAALQAVFGNKDELTNYVPPIWMFAPMTGRSILDETTNKQGK